MAGQSKNITLYVFLFALFITLAMVLGARTYNLFTGSKTETESTMKSTMQCAFSYSLSNMEYSDGVLRFDLKTTDEELFKKIIVVGHDGPKEIALGTYINFRQGVRVEQIPMGDSFLVYPEGCEGQNNKTCLISEGRCN
ncbi:hypothetical protein COV19_02210 [Candidatus Woesearchaeota archaeon CG10_big_fil_rev_8_21_14_0_10_44_13]|nr:MAG: hypothetical protein COV19_02210 [Candidatus Woesearchaeota archaeon CG10_big_fil_rev_8_21_14_0_10_44_13]